MEFRLLGAVELTADGRQIDLGPPRQRSALAALLVDAGQPVTADAMIDRIWGEDPPPEARNALYSHVARIRRLLAEAAPADGPPGAAPVTVERRSGGYALRVDRDRIDLFRFRRLVERARVPGGPAQDRAGLLRQALALWRGEPLGGVAGEWADQVREGIAQQRLAALVLWGQLELELGHYDVVIDQISDTLVRHPLAEPLIATTMRAMFRSGRAAEALACYADARQRLADELGTEPGPELRELHQAVLRGDPAGVGPPAAAAAAPGAVPAPAARPVPAQLPPDVPVFAGRAVDLRRLDTLLPADGTGPRTMVVSAIGGTAGIGKTTLAVHWGHRVADRFPDGQLYVNLRGFEPGSSMVAPTEAVRGFLDALGVPPNRVPVDLDGRVGLYRSLLAHRRMLIVLDNAHDAQQVRSLLPGAPGCRVVVTSRNQLTSLIVTEGAQPVTLDLLSPAEARQLLIRRLGEARLAAAPAAVDELISRCAGLPLALSITAARAATRPGMSLADLAGEFQAERGRLSAFDAGDALTNLRTVFAGSYRHLDAAAARLFRLLGSHPGAEIAAASAASMAGVTVAEVRPMLGELTRAHLMIELSPDRYTFHDLLRSYAAELAEELDPATDRTAATHRLFDHYVHTAHRAALLVDPHRDPIPLAAARAGVTVRDLADRDAAIGWLDTERQALLAAVQRRAGFAVDRHIWHLTWATATFLDIRGHWGDLITIHQTALEATRRLGDRDAEARCEYGLGRSYYRLSRYDAAEPHLRRGLALYRELGDPNGQAQLTINLAVVLGETGRHQEALELSREAYELFRAAGRPNGQARALNAVGWYSGLLGRHEDALAHCRRALAMHEELGDRHGIAETTDSVGHAYFQLGEFQQAIAHYERALELMRALGDAPNQAEMLDRLGDARLAAGQPGAATEAWRQAADRYDRLSHPAAASVRAKLDTAHQPSPAGLS